MVMSTEQNEFSEDNKDVNSMDILSIRVPYAIQHHRY